MQKTLEISLSKGEVALIDADDYPLVAAHSWYVSQTSKNFRYAVSGAKQADGRRATIYMHRLITGAPKGKVVDHINHNTLDNRRANLRVGSHKDNMQNGRFALTTHCPKGHAYDEANTYINAKGKRICRACNALRVAAIYEAETPRQRKARADQTKAYYLRTWAERRANQKAYADARKKEKRAYDMARYRRLKQGK